MTRVTGHGSRVMGGLQTRRGFTLLEVMVAVVIMATVLVSLIGLKNRSMQDVMFAEHITTATLLAKRKMVETISLSKKLQDGEEEGSFSDEEDLKDKEDFKGYTWRKVVSSIPLPPPAVGSISEVRIAVLWKEGTRDEMVELVSYE